MQLMDRPLAFTLAKAGSSMLARMAMMAMTTRSSIKVNAGGRGLTSDVRQTVWRRARWL
jgi:hypothetical protein